MSFQTIEFDNVLYDFPTSMSDAEISAALDADVESRSEDSVAQKETLKASGTTFDAAIGEVLKNEGGYVNDPADAGGETNHGISKRSYPGLDIKNLTQGDAVEIYKMDYWDSNSYSETLPSIGAKMLDMAINMGSSRANKILQKVVGTKEDGIIGPKTLAAVAKMDEEILISALIVEQSSFYKNLAKKRPTNKKFLNGWLARANRLPIPIGTEYADQQLVSTVEDTTGISPAEVDREQAFIDTLIERSGLAKQQLREEEMLAEIFEDKPIVDETPEQASARQEQFRKQLGIGEFAMKKVEGGLFEDADGNLVIVDETGNRRELECG